MPQRNRRRTIIGLGVLAIGASGAVASGTVSLGSEGSLGDEFVQVTGVEQAVSFESFDIPAEPNTDGADAVGSEGTTDSDTEDDGTGDGDTGNGDAGNSGSDGGDSGSDPVSTRVEVVVDPSADNGINSGGPASWGGSIFDTGYVESTADGYLRGIRDDELNQNAVTQIGRVTDGPPGSQVAFLIANVGPAEADVETPPVTITMSLLDGDSVFTTNQIRFPYRVLTTTGRQKATGNDLSTAGGVEVATGELIELAIELDTTTGVSGIERLSGIQFSATR